jgi:dipeptidyl aminopeptidase/acylaminoacyl peptidase
MTRFRIYTFVLFAVISGLACVPAVAADRQPMSVDDMMKVEGIGSAAIDPTGSWLIYERLRPYEQSDDFSFGSYAFARTGHQLWRYDLRSGKDVELLPGLDPAPHSYLQGFSPSGRYLAIMQYRYGDLSLGAYDMAHGKVVRFKGTSALSRDGAHNPVWISDTELVFAVLPAGELPDTTSVRSQTGRALTKAWEEAWKNTVATASEVRSSPEDLSGEQEAGSLVRADASTGKSRVLAEGLYADIRVSPDRRLLAALAVSKPRPTDPTKLQEEDPRRYRLTLFNLQTGEKHSLASGLEFFPYTIAWAPDGRHLAAYGWTPDQTPRDGRFYVIDVQSGSAVRFDHVGLDLTSERERGWLQRPERVSFLGNGLTVFARRIPGQEDQAPRFSYKDVRPVGLSKPDWYLLSPDGTSRNLTADLLGVSGIPVHAGNGHLTVAADDGVYRLYADGQRRRLTPVLPGRFTLLQSGTFTTRSSVIRPEFSNEALLSVTSDSKAKIVMVDLRDGHEGQNVAIEVPTDSAAPLAGSLAAGKVLFRAEDGPVSKLLLATSGTNAAPLEIAGINTHLADVDLGSWKVVSYQVKAPDGAQSVQTIESCVLLPPGYQPNNPPPLIVEVYPNAEPTCKNGGQQIGVYSVNWSPYLWSGKGYAYARLSTPRALVHTGIGPIAGMPAAVDAGVDALARERLIDPNRTVIVGYSQGGISALYVAAHSKKFRAVIAMNSWADLFSQYFGPNGIYSYTYGEYFGDFIRYDSEAGSDFGIGRTPFEDPGIYIRNSPVFLAPQIDAPVMLVHSDMDSFSMYQFDEMYGALSRAGKDVRYVRYWGEGHGPSSPANIRDLWQRMDTFLIDNGVMVRKAEPE